MIKDMSNMRFGRLKVIALDVDNRKKGAYWICKCDCGNRTSVAGVELRRGGGRGTKSCGCLIRIKSQGNRKYNSYKFDEDYGIGITSHGVEFYFDKEDYELIKNYCWRFHYNYITTTINNKTVRLHRLIMGAKDGEIVDHINRCTIDNRRGNLRFICDSGSATNISLKSNNTSGKTGVSYHNRDEIWIGYIVINGKNREIIRTKNKDEAILKRLEYEEKYYGEYSPNYNNGFKMDENMI